MAFSVATQTFEGPFDLLLTLVEKRKLFVNDLALSDVAENFLQYINEHGSELDERTSFLFVAATLLLIKSRSLLPGVTLTEEEKESIDDLEIRLKKYERVRHLGGFIKELWGGSPLSYTTPHPIAFAPRFAPDTRLNPELMVLAMKSVLSSIPKKEILPEIHVHKSISLESVIASLEERIAQEMSLGFRAFSGFHNRPHTKEEKIMVIVSFLAMLELTRSGLVELEVSDDDIHIKRRAPEVFNEQTEEQESTHE